MNKNYNKFLKVIDKIEKIRSKNNSNWMDILRLAFRHSPREASRIMCKLTIKISRFLIYYQNLMLIKDQKAIVFI